MRKLFAFGAALAVASSAYAAPNVAQNTQKGSALIFPDVIAFEELRNGYAYGPENTVIKLSNDGAAAVDVKCIWMDSNKNRTDFIVTLTKNQTIWFDAREGDGTTFVNPMPKTPSNGWKTLNTEPTGRGMLVCFAVDATGRERVKWNHLYATATVFNEEDAWAYEYTAYAFYHQLGNEGQPIGGGGANGVGLPEELQLVGQTGYDQCPIYQVGAFHPAYTELVDKRDGDWFKVKANRLAIAGCSIDLRQDYTPTFTKWVVDVWDSNEVKYTGGFKCADTWSEILFPDLDAGSQVLTRSTIDTDVARFRIQAASNTQCENQSGGSNGLPGILAIQSTKLQLDWYVPCDPAVESGPRCQDSGYAMTGTNLSAGGKVNGIVKYDLSGAVEEGRVR